MEIIIVFDNSTARERASFGSGVNVTGGEKIQFMPVLFATTDPSQIPSIQSKPGVESVKRDHQVRIPTPEVNSTDGAGITTSTVGQAVPWGVQRIGASQVAERIRHNATQNVTIAILDTGIDYTHPDISGSVIWGADFTYGGEQYGLETATDNNGHGTAVAGLIAAADNNQGIVGVAPGAQLYSIKVLRANNVGTISSLIKGIDASIKGPDGVVGTNDDADIVQTSLGTSTDDAQLEYIVTAASDYAILISAAGNNGDGDPETAEVAYPAKYKGAIAVAAANQQNETTIYSAEGPGIDIAAPGHMLQTLASEGGTVYFSGTSAATPVASGAVALLLASDQAMSGGNQTGAETRALLTSTAQDIETVGVDRFSGHGLIRADRAVAPLALASGSRTVSKTTVASGDTVTVTVHTYAPQKQLTISESFTPSFAGSEIEAVLVNRTSRPAVSQISSANRSVVTLDGLKIGDEVTVKYVVRVPKNTTGIESYRIAGEITSGGMEHELGTSNLTVSSKSLSGIAAVYDSNANQKIELTELAAAATDYAGSDLTLTELANVAQAYASS